jgi:glycosyltransferase involved in cell wall biosynthesis
MSETSPAVSILITTYNRSRLLHRAIESVFMQDFTDFELVIIDDCSTDDTPEVIASFKDPRIRSIRNKENVGSKEGDRAHMRRFVYELMRGTYFVYLCDDDYWLYPDLLRRQVSAFEIYDDVVMVMGGQLSYFLTTPESYFGRGQDDTMTLTLDNLDPYFDFDTLTPKTPHLYFMHGGGPQKSLFQKMYMTSEEFLNEFADDPTSKNIIGGAMLYSRETFIKAGGFSSPTGSQWQAGYELKMGPACYGGVVYLNEPSIVTEIRAGNASFRGTQAEHYLDSLVSLEAAFETPLASEALKYKRSYLKYVRAKTTRNLSRAFLRNTVAIRRRGELGMCSADNMSRPVTYREVLPALVRTKAWYTLELVDLKLLLASALPDMLFKAFDAKYIAIRDMNPGKPAATRAMPIGSLSAAIQYLLRRIVA